MAKKQIEIFDLTFHKGDSQSTVFLGVIDAIESIFRKELVGLRDNKKLIASINIKVAGKCVESVQSR